MSSNYTAVLDRIVDGKTAVLLLEAGESVADEVTVPLDQLPEAGRHDGAVFEATLQDGDLSDLEYRPESEQSRREAAQDRFDSLSRRLGEE